MQRVLERCTIRPWRLDDAELLMKHANNRKVWLALRDLFPHPYTIHDAHKFLQQAISEQPTTNFCIEVQGMAAGGIGMRLETTSTDTLRDWVTGLAKIFGDAAS
jgi:[ribosomal protein S5]-alanine N-acetyltransferase